MADFVELTTAETGSKAKIRQALIRKVKDNFTNLNARMTVEESQIRLFDHFNKFFGTGDLSFGPDVATGVHTEFTTKDWSIFVDSDASRAIFNAAKPSWSVARLGAGTGGAFFGYLQSILIHQFNESTKPIICEARLKLSADIVFLSGMRKPYVSGGLVDAEGIWLERVDSSNWRFVSYDTSRNNGSNFTKPTTGTWFKVRIEFDSTSGNEARCYIDDVLKETLVTQLPTTKRLAATHRLAGTTAGNYDLDLQDWKSAGIALAA